MFDRRAHAHHTKGPALLKSETNTRTLFQLFSLTILNYVAPHVVLKSFWQSMRVVYAGGGPRTVSWLPIRRHQIHTY